MKSTSVLLSIAAVAHLTYASVVPPTLSFATQGGLNIPRGCESDCATANNAITNCADAACLCKNPVMQAIGRCFDCALVVGGGTQSDMADAQAALNEVINQCRAAGFPLNPVTVDGRRDGSSSAVSGSPSLVPVTSTSGALPTTSTGALPTVSSGVPSLVPATSTVLPTTSNGIVTSIVSESTSARTTTPTTSASPSSSSDGLIRPNSASNIGSGYQTLLVGAIAAAFGAFALA